MGYWITAIEQQPFWNIIKKREAVRKIICDKYGLEGDCDIDKIDYEILRFAIDNGMIDMSSMQEAMKKEVRIRYLSLHLRVDRK